MQKFEAVALSWRKSAAIHSTLLFTSVGHHGAAEVSFLFGNAVFFPAE